jgi:hypothetical protein
LRSCCHSRFSTFRGSTSKGVLGNTVEEAGLGQALGEPDNLCIPVPGTLIPSASRRTRRLDIAFGIALFVHQIELQLYRYHRKQTAIAVEEAGLGQALGEPDNLCIPVPGTLIPSASDPQRDIAFGIALFVHQIELQLYRYHRKQTAIAQLLPQPVQHVLGQALGEPDNLCIPVPGTLIPSASDPQRIAQLLRK